MNGEDVVGRKVVGEYGITLSRFVNRSSAGDVGKCTVWLKSTNNMVYTTGIVGMSFARKIYNSFNSIAAVKLRIDSKGTITPQKWNSW